MDTVKCFRYDQWLDLTPDQLEPGDQFTHQGESVAMEPWWPKVVMISEQQVEA